MIQPKLEIHKLPTGVPGLDEVLRGGLPEYSLTLIAGGPGSGKTTLSHQIIFANGRSDRPALHFSTLGESTLQVLRFQQQFAFFDAARVGNSVRYHRIGPETVVEGADAVLHAVATEVQRSTPRMVVIDSFRTIVPAGTQETDAGVKRSAFVQRLAVLLASWEVTGLLAGQYPESELGWTPISSVADGILWLRREIGDRRAVRSLEVMKMRGTAPWLGRHAMEITARGVRVHPGTVPSRGPAEADGTASH